MVALTYRMNSGIPGNVSRESQASIESGFYDSTAPFPAYGVLGKINSASGKFNMLQGGEAAYQVYGILVRPYPTTGLNSSDPIGTAVPPTSGMCNILRRGYISAKLNNGAAINGGQVYGRVSNPSGAKIIGGFEAIADATTTPKTGITGNGTISAVTLGTIGWQTGAYKALFTGATTFNVVNVNGDIVSNGVTGTALTVDGLTFTITAGGTAFVAGDFFTVQTNAVILPATFMGAADASGNVEIAYNI